MTLVPTARRSPRRAVVVVVLAVLGSLLMTGPARGAGTGGIEVTPLPAMVDGEQVTAFRVELPAYGSKEVSFLLRNVEEGERTARLYAARATQSADGSFDVGDPGSSAVVSYPTQVVTLAEGEQRVERFTVERPEGDQPSELTYSAIVVEVSNGAIVQRAATLVYVQPGRQLPAPLPVLIVLVAAALIGAVAVGLALVARRRRSAPDAA